MPPYYVVARIMKKQKKTAEHKNLTVYEDIPSVAAVCEKY